MNGSIDESQLGGGSISSITKKNKKCHLGGPMNKEELKMNRFLLKDISEMKKKAVNKS